MNVSEAPVSRLDISTVEMSDADFAARVKALDVLADEMNAADEATEVSKRRLLDARLEFAVRYSALYAAVEGTEIRVQQLRERYELKNRVEGCRWNKVGERAEDIRLLVKLDDDYYSPGHLRIRTTFRGLSSLATALNRNLQAVFDAFRDTGFEPTVRALDAIGTSIVNEPVEPELAKSKKSAAGTDANTSENADAESRIAAEPAENKPRTITNELRSRFTNYLNRLHSLLDTNEPLPAVDYHEQARKVFQTTDCAASIAGVEFIKDRQVLRVVTDYRMDDLDWEMVHGRSSGVGSVDNAWKDIEEALSGVPDAAAELTAVGEAEEQA